MPNYLQDWNNFRSFTGATPISPELTEEERLRQEQLASLQTQEAMAPYLPPLDSNIASQSIAPIAPVITDTDIPSIPTKVAVREPSPDSPYSPKSESKPEEEYDMSGVKEVGSDPLSTALSSIKDPKLRSYFSGKISDKMNSDQEGTSKPKTSDKTDKEMRAAQKEANFNRSFSKYEDSVNRLVAAINKTKPITTLKEDLEASDRPVEQLKDRRAQALQKTKTEMEAEAHALRKLEVDARLKGDAVQLQHVQLQLKKLDFDIAKNSKDLELENRNRDPNSNESKIAQKMLKGTTLGKELEKDGTLNLFTANDLTNRQPMISLREQIADRASARSEAKAQRDFTREENRANRIADYRMRRADKLQDIEIKDGKKLEEQRKKESVPGFDRSEDAPILRETEISDFRKSEFIVKGLRSKVERLRALKNKYGAETLNRDAVHAMAGLQRDLQLGIKEFKALGSWDQGTATITEDMIPGDKDYADASNSKLDEFEQSLNDDQGFRAETLGYVKQAQNKSGTGRTSLSVKTVNEAAAKPYSSQSTSGSTSNGSTSKTPQPSQAPKAIQPGFTPKAGFTLIEINGTPRYVPNDKVQEELQKSGRKLVQ